MYVDYVSELKEPFHVRLKKSPNYLLTTHIVRWSQVIRQVTVSSQLLPF